MKIGIFKGKNYNEKIIDLKKLQKNIGILRSNPKDKFTKYILKVFKKINKTEFKSIENIYDEIEENYSVKIIRNQKEFTSYDLVISSTHDNSYHLFKKLNYNKDPLTIICFDMHCDLYDAKEKLWKGNHFSKLMQEKYISDLIVYEVPKYKKEMTLNQIDQRCRNHVTFAYSKHDIFKTLKKNKTKHVIFSIDIDCFDSLKSNYTAIPYCPYRVLKELSTKRINKNISKDKISQISKDCVLIKNDKGYENMYRAGENKLSIDRFGKMFKSIIKYCAKNNILVGYKIKDLKIISDITEVDGDDVNGNTFILIDRLINVLKEVRQNESFISKKIS